MKDLFGKAILDFQTNNSPQNIFTETSISEEDEMEISYLFRNFNQMPMLEQKALQLCKGSILDVGCGAGSHSLYLQNELNLNVTSIDISQNAIKTCNLRGLKKAKVQNVLEVKNETFDTILILMNGTGIFGTLSETPKYLQKLKSLLNKKGQILIDSSDLIYMFDEDDDGGKWILGDKYYGELTFKLKYKNQIDEPFNWLYLDFNTLKNSCLDNNLVCDMIFNGDNFDYLVKITTF